MTLRLNAYDFVYNDTLMYATEKTSFNMYRTFDKVRHCLSGRAKERNISINLQSNGECGELRAYDCIELLAYILLDNGLKYANAGTQIEVTINDNAKICSFRVSTQSSPLKHGEMERIYERGFRGENARLATSDGMGIGLYTAKRICQLHNATISAHEENSSNFKNNIFVIDIVINKEYTI